METNKLIAGIVAAAIAVIVLAGVLMPVLSNATTTHETLKNIGYFNVSEVDENTDVVISWDHTDPKKITVGDAVVDMAAIPDNTPVTILGCNGGIVRYINNSSGITEVYYNGAGGQTGATSTGTTDATITIVSESITIQFGTATRTPSYTDAIFIDPAGPYVMKDKDVPAYIQDDTLVIAGMTKTVDNVNVGLFGIGNIDDGLTINDITGSTTYSFENISINTSTTQYVDTVLLNTITFDIVNTGTESVTASTYSYFAVPAEMVAERTVHLDPAMNGILNVIPLLIIVAVLLGVVAVFILRRE